MSGTLEKLYAGAKRAEAAKRAKNGGRKPKVKRAKAKGGKKPKSKPKTGKRKANKKVKILAESLAMLLDGQLRHGAGSPGVTAVAHALGLNGHPIRHGAGSTNYDARSRAHLKRRKPKAPKAKPARSRREPRTAFSREVDEVAARLLGRSVSSKTTTKRVKTPKSNRSRRPGENFAQHMARLRKVDGR
jgi:hypothetical protein